MVLSFSKDPFDSGSVFSNACSDNGAEPQSVGEESSVCSGSLGNGASANLLDEWLKESVPRDPNFFNVPTDDPSTTLEPPTHVGPGDPVPVNNDQSRRPTTPKLILHQRSDACKLPLEFLTRTKTIASSIQLIDWRDTFCSDFHFTMNSNPAAWSAFMTGFGKAATPSEFQKFIDCDLKTYTTAFLGSTAVVN
ncbi:hypothetical protein ACA910_008143 [Epithemia clementina (nom. ined.)]